MDRAHSPYLRFLGTRYRRVVLRVVQHGPEGAHKDVLTVIDEELDYLGARAKGSAPDRVRRLRNRIAECHRENAAFYRLVAERAAIRWEEDAEALTPLVALLPEPPEAIRAAYENQPVNDIAAFERFRFLRGAKQITPSLFEPNIISSSPKVRGQVVFNLVGGAPKSLVRGLLSAVGTELRNAGHVMRVQDLKFLEKKHLVGMNSGAYSALPGTPGFEGFLARFYEGRLLVSDLRFVRHLFSEKADLWALLTKTATSHRARGFQKISGRPSSEYGDYLARLLLKSTGQSRQELLASFSVSDLHKVVHGLLQIQERQPKETATTLGQVLNRFQLSRFASACRQVLPQLNPSTRLRFLEELRDSDLKKVGDRVRLLDPRFVLDSLGHEDAATFTKKEHTDWHYGLKDELVLDKMRFQMPLEDVEFFRLISLVLQGKCSRKSAMKALTPQGAPCWQKAVQSVSLSRNLRGEVWIRPDDRNLIQWIEAAPRTVRREALALNQLLEGFVTIPAPKVVKKRRRVVTRMPRSQAMATEISEACGGWSPAAIRHLIILAWSARQAGAALGYSLDGHYRTYELPKGAGGTRTITVPSNYLKAFQRVILRHLIDPIGLEDSVHGFRKGHSIGSNAALHIGKRLVINADIDSFFPSVQFTLVHAALKRAVGGVLTPSSVRFLAEVCCYNGALPTGAPTSPGVANLVLTPIDKAIQVVCARHNISYTRYADDLTFSGDGDARRIIPFVRKCLAGLGLELDSKKLNLYRRGRRQIVTGLVVNDKVNVPRRTRRRLRAAVHQASTGQATTWHGKTMNENQLMGRIAFLHAINPDEAKALKARLTPPGVPE